ncbi:MAG: IPT/TIG domain-containing protein [Candidatus Zixiibacteriota bacterium]
MKRIAFLTALIAIVIWACSDKGSEPKDKPPTDNPPGAPVIDSLSTDRGYVNDTLEVYGKSFGESQDTASSVKFGSIHAGVIFWTDTRIAIRVPEGAKTGDVSVNVDTLTSNTVAFIVYGIDHIEPDSGGTGTEVWIYGIRFGYHQYGKGVTFNGVQADESYWSDTLIITTVPSQARTGQVKIEMLNRDYDGGLFRVIGALRIEELRPSTGTFGTQLEIIGDFFGETQGSSRVSFNGVNPDILSWSDGRIVTTYPVGCTSGELTVTVDGEVSNAMPYSVFGITSISPNWGAPGDTITVSGTGFGDMQGANSVEIDGVEVSVVEWTPEQIVCELSAESMRGTLTVSIGGMLSNGVQIYVFYVDRMEPVEGPVETEVSIYGRGFGDSQGYHNYVSFAGTRANTLQWSDSQIVVQVPYWSTTGDVLVKLFGHPISAGTFTVDCLFAVTGVEPDWGPPGTMVTITGSGFGINQGSSRVRFGNTLASVISWDDTEIVVSVPNIDKSGVVSVSAANCTSSGILFSVYRALDLVPDVGLPGDTLAILGSGFWESQAGSEVLFGELTPEIAEWTDSLIRIIVPAEASDCNVTVLVNGILSPSFDFWLATTSDVTGFIKACNVMDVSFSFYGRIYSTWRYALIHLPVNEPGTITWEEERVIAHETGPGNGTEGYSYIDFDGSLSFSENRIDSLFCKYFYHELWYGPIMEGYERDYSFMLRDIPLSLNSIADSQLVRFSLEGSAAEEHVENVRMYYRGFIDNSHDEFGDGYFGWGDWYSILRDIDWDNETYPPRISVTFRKE